jgi:hypothetical protein
VERAGILDLGNVTKPWQDCQRRLRQQRLQIAGLLQRSDGILVPPQQRYRDLDAL